MPAATGIEAAAVLPRAPLALRAADRVSRSGERAVKAFMLIGAALLSVAPAAAQQVETRVPVPGTRFDPPPGAVVDDAERVFGDEASGFAPLAIVGALGLRPFATLVTEYDSNIARRPDDQPLPQRFESRSDWIFRPTVGLSLERPVGRQRLFASASVGRAIYARNDRLNNNRVNVGGGLGFVAGRACNGQVNAGYSKRDILIGNFADAGAATTESTNLGGTLSCATASGLTGSVGYSRGSNRNITSDPALFDRSFADADFQSVNGSIGYRLGARGQVGVSASWGETAFPNQILFGQEVENEIRTIALVGSYRIGSTLRANASIGQTEVKSNVPGAPGFSGGTWSAGLGYAGPRFGANLRAARSVNGGGQQAANFAVAQSYTGSVTYRLNDSMSVSGGYSYNDQDFRGTALVPGTLVLQSITDNRAFVGANYRLNRILSFTADLNRQRRSANPDFFSFESTSVIFGIRVRL